ncbi:MAG TPA: hypothetical protein PLA05_03115 [bacterium]|nr:MAG: hypothetical protein BWX82_00214 [Parcubacteria group bacterium ADurb.Bin115]HNU81770.1 hypothetical protein [bacterium]HPW05922.1 hypothetical protein [bacterium]
MQNVWSVVCKNSIIDGETNSLSLLETLDEITINYREGIDSHNVKLLPVSFHIVTLWFDENVKKDRKFILSIDIIDPKGKVLNTFNQDCVIPTGSVRLRATSKINGFSFTDEGKYLVVVKYKQTGKFIQVAEIPVSIHFKKEA